MAGRLDLRKGTRVLYRLTDGSWREAALVRGSPTGEEWLVKNVFGSFWVPVTQLRPATESQPGQ